MVMAMLVPKAVDRTPPKKDLRDPDDSATDSGASPVADPELLIAEPPPLVLYAAVMEPSRGIEATNANRQNRRDIMVADARVRNKWVPLRISTL